MSAEQTLPPHKEFCAKMTPIAFNICYQNKKQLPWFRQIFHENCSKKSEMVFENCVSLAERTNMFELKDPIAPSAPSS